MDKIDFSDINKFVTSIGLILIGLAFVLPLFVNQNAEILLIEENLLNKSTPEAQTIIHFQQKSILNHLTLMPYLFFSFIGIGLSLVIYGLIRWNARQKVIYGIQDEEWRLKKMEGISSEQKKENISNEIGEDEPEKEKTINKYLQLEDNIYLKLASAYSVNYQVEHNVSVDRANFDVILKSKFTNKRPDIIVEIKYYTRILSPIRFQSDVRKFLLAITNYEQSLQRSRVTPVFILLLNSEKSIEQMKESDSKIKENAKNLGFNNLRILYRLASTIDELSAEQFLVE